MRVRRIVAPMIGCMAVALSCGVLAASAQAQPGGPALVGSVTDPINLSGATDVAVSGSYAYSTAYYSGELTAINISNPAAPVVAGESPEFVQGTACPGTQSCDTLNGTTVTISGGYAYVVSKNQNGTCTPGPPPSCASGTNDDGTGNSLTIFDIHTNPAVPALVGSIQNPTELFGAYGLAVQGGYAYIAAQGCLSGQPCPNSAVGNQFVVVNVSNPASPSIAADVTNPTMGSATNALDHADSVAISGDYAYVTSSYQDTLAVFNISNPTAPSLVASFASPSFGAPNDVAIQGNYAYVVDQIVPAGRLVVVNISNPTSPSVVGSIQDPSLNNAYRVAVRGSYAYVASAGADTMDMINISNPAAPTIAATVFSTGDLNHTTGLDFSPSGRYLVMSSPFLSSQTQTNYPPYPLQTGGPSATGTVSVIDLDPNPVSVSITGPVQGNNYKQGSVVDASYSCTPGGLIPVTSCAGPVASGAPIDTSSLGTHSFTVVGTDQDGQTGSATVTYTVSTTGGPKPSLSGLHQSAPVWREHGRKHARHKPPLGSTFTFKLSETSKVTLSFSRCTARRSGHGGVCKRTRFAGRIVLIGKPGKNRYFFVGQIGRKFLKPGTYKLVVVASANGKSSATQTISFTIV